MCEFCHKHGEGKKWYLQAKNYSEDLLSDLRRRNFIKRIIGDPEYLDKSVKKIGEISRAPGLVRRALGRAVTNRLKRDHFGQVVPIEEIERIFGFVSSVARFTCLCRHISAGVEYRCCYGLSISPKGGEFLKIMREIDAGYLNGPDTIGIESVSKEETLAALRDHEQSGLCHTVWSFVTPFIGAICNCDQKDCLAMRVSISYGVPAMFRAEFVAEVAPDLCTGCRECINVCQFGALEYNLAQDKVSVDPSRCYGCGVCRSVCVNDAISLSDRISVPIAAKIW